MAKFMSLMLLVVVAISWSETNASPVKRSVAKRSTEEIIDEDTSSEEFAKELFAGILLLDATPEEKVVLEKRFEHAGRMKYDSMDEYAVKLLGIFEEVTGRKFSVHRPWKSTLVDSAESFEVLDDDYPFAGPRTMRV